VFSVIYTLQGGNY